MEVGKNFVTSLEMQRHYPKMYEKMYGKRTTKPKKLAVNKKRIEKKLKAQKVKAVKAPTIKKKEAKVRGEPGLGVVKKIRKAKAPKVDRGVKKDGRLAQNNSKLLEQLLFINQRIETMEKDKEKYALVDCLRTVAPITYEFKIVKLGEPTPVIIRVNENSETSCSCMDWRIRCKTLSVPCKHIYYLLTKILTYELYDYFDNQIMKAEEFRQLVNSRINFGLKFTVKEDKEIDGEFCPVCYSDFLKTDKIENILQCPDCRNLVHKECMLTWMNHSTRRNCVCCKSEKWTLLFKNYQ
jgi:hypothetical protein